MWNKAVVRGSGRGGSQSQSLSREQEGDGGLVGAYALIIYFFWPHHDEEIEWVGNGFPWFHTQQPFNRDKWLAVNQCPKKL